MSNTPIQITADLSQVLERIEKKIDGITKDVTDLKVGQAKLEGDIKALDEKVNGLGKRLDNQEFINRSVVVGLFLTILVGAIKLFFPNFPTS